MRIIHVTDAMAKMSGGVPAVVSQLSQGLEAIGATAHIIHATGGSDRELVKSEILKFPPSSLGMSWSFSPTLQSGISSFLSNFSSRTNGGEAIVHVHGVWGAPQYYASKIAYQKTFPFVLSAHGMLEPWLWNQQGATTYLKKKMYWASIAFPKFKYANVIHAITKLEGDNLSRLFPKNRIEIIPNAIAVNKINVIKEAPLNSKSILFLGRIEPKKGVDLLLCAFASANLSKEWTLNIAGPVWSNSYLSKLKKIINEKELGERVVFHGPVFGVDKILLINAAWVLAAPSHSEAMGLVNLEAAERCLPTITTYATGLYDWENNGGGLLINPDIESLRKALISAASWSDQERFERGLVSRNLVEKCYSWDAVMPMWLELYSSF